MNHNFEIHLQLKHNVQYLKNYWSQQSGYDTQFITNPDNHDNKFITLGIYQVAKHTNKIYLSRIASTQPLPWILHFTGMLQFLLEGIVLLKGKTLGHWEWDKNPEKTTQEIEKKFWKWWPSARVCIFPAWKRMQERD